jgi:hypothetical protein
VDATQSVSVQASKVEGGLLLTFALGAADNRAFADGSVTIRWVPKVASPPAPGHGPIKPFHPILTFAPIETSEQSAMAARIAAAAKLTKESDAIKLPPLPPEKVSELIRQLKKPPVAKHTVHVQIARGALTNHPQKAAQDIHPKTRVVPDPVKSEKDQHRSQAICAAYTNNIPGIPGACNK